MHMASRNFRPVAHIKALQRRIGKELFSQPHFRALLDGIENVSLFIKSPEGRLVFGNRSLLRRLGLRNEAELLGRSDWELLPPHLVEKYHQDDLEVIASGREKLNLIEMFKTEQGLLQWFITHKYPIFDRKGRVIGIMGSIQEYGKTNRAIGTDEQGIMAAAEYIQRNYRSAICIEELARLGGMPMRQFQRKFKLIFDASPREYIIRHRLHDACEALRHTRKSIVKICAEAGFYDQSSFTRQFRKYMNMTPLKYRKGASAAS
jgi:PAS domain S-box-containing protein